MKKRNLLIVLILIAFCAVFSISNVFCAEPAAPRKGKSIRELIIQLNKEYLFLDDELKKLEENMRDFPRTNLTVSVIKKDSGYKLVSIELLDNNRLLAGHIYTSTENEALNTGGRHLLYIGEIADGSHNLSIVYSWSKGDKTPQKGDAIVPVSISSGKNTSLELSFEKKEDRMALRPNQLEFSNR